MRNPATRSSVVHVPWLAASNATFEALFLEFGGKETTQLKTLVGARTPGAAGVDPDALATRGELEALRAEVAKSNKRTAAQERELATGRLRSELDEMTRMLRSFQLKTRPDE